MRIINKIIRAFSLTELMIVIAIVAFISAVAVPNYKSYLNKSKVTNMISTIEPCQIQVYQTFLQTASFPQTVTCYGKSLNATMSTSSLRGNINAAYIVAADGSFAQFKVQSDVVSVGTTLANLYIRFTQSSLTSYGGGDIGYLCGTVSSDANSMPTKYLPAGCTDVMS